MLSIANRAMKKPQIDYDSVAEIYDLYVTADYDIPFFLAETTNAKGPVLELTSGTGWGDENVWRKFVPILFQHILIFSIYISYLR
jgi:hypothetical protein